MTIISVIKCFVISIIIIIFSCLSFASNSNAINIDNRLKTLVSSTSSDSSSIGANTNANDNRNQGKISSDSVDKGSCTTKSDCPSTHSYCDQHSHSCKCKSEFVNIVKLMNGSRTKQWIPTCFPVAKLDEPCASHEQCLVTNSICMYYYAYDLYSRNASTHYCKCKEGYQQEDREEVIVRENQRLVNHPVCGEFVSMGNSWIGTFAIVCIMLLIILIGCFIGILRFQRWKQRPMASTVTSLAAATGHTPHLMSSSPPPMGSVEAEFQNDFIQVFPMHHLEPMPDKNTYSSHEFVIK